jgi:hypothetical protein
MGYVPLGRKIYAPEAFKKLKYLLLILYSSLPLKYVSTTIQIETNKCNSIRLPYMIHPYYLEMRISILTVIHHTPIISTVVAQRLLYRHFDLHCKKELNQMHAIYIYIYTHTHTHTKAVLMEVKELVEKEEQ